MVRPGEPRSGGIGCTAKPRRKCDSYACLSPGVQLSDAVEGAPFGYRGCTPDCVPDQLQMPLICQTLHVSVAMGYCEYGCGTRPGTRPQT